MISRVNFLTLVWAFDQLLRGQMVTNGKSTNRCENRHSDFGEKTK